MNKETDLPVNLKTVQDPALLSSEALARRLSQVATEKKGFDLVIYDVAALLGITDYFVVCSCNGPLQVKAIAKESLRLAKSLGCRSRGTEGSADSGWMLVDVEDVVCHIFDRETRAYYDFDILWGDAKRLDLPADETKPA